MIPSILIMLIAFYWLLKETNYLRVRLLVGLECKDGACCDWRLPNEAVDRVMQHELLTSWNLDKLERIHFDYNLVTPLCGWGFAYQYRNFKPEYKIELISDHSKITIKSNSMPHLRDAFKVYRNPWAKVALKAH